MDSKSEKIKTVCLFARECGIKILKRLLEDKRFTIVRLLVHSRLPKSEDPNKSLRPEFPIFKAIAQRYFIPLSIVDSREEARNLMSLQTGDAFDFLITVSWRFLIPKYVFEKARIAAINVHRGKLPKYAGAEPIKRALANGEKDIVLTVHELTEKIDEGRVLVEKEYPVNFDNTKTIEENVEEIKMGILPLYSEAVLEAIDKILKVEGCSSR